MKESLVGMTEETSQNQRATILQLLLLRLLLRLLLLLLLQLRLLLLLLQLQFNTSRVFKLNSPFLPLAAET